MERTMQVRGNAKLSIKPDMIRMRLKLEGIREEYKDAVEDCAVLQALLVQGILMAGFEQEELRTESFQVDTEYESYQEGGAWKQRMVGYRFRQSLILEMDADNDLLEKTLERIVESQAGPEISLEYTLRDQEDAREELIFRAVEDAINKAYIISQASGVGMGDILTIQYSTQEPDFISPTRNHIPEAAVMMAARTGGQKLAGDVRPMNIELEDTVTMVLEIS